MRILILTLVPWLKTNIKKAIYFAWMPKSKVVCVQLRKLCQYAIARLQFQKRLRKNFRFRILLHLATKFCRKAFLGL